MHSPKAIVTILALLAATLALTTSSGPVNAQAASLGAAARDGLAVGAVLHGYDSGFDQGEYAATAATEFSAVTGTIYKGWNGWDNLADGIDTSGWDAVVDWATARGKLVHGHTLVYPLSTAASPWYTRDANIDHEAVMRQYVTAVASSRAGQVWVWDVVNEVMADNGQPQDQWGLRTDWIEYEKIGADYVDKAFSWAKAADPNALLIINDYGAEEINAKSNSLLAYATDLRRRGVPIDGVGFQMHWQGHLSEPNYPSIRANMARFADAGFKIFFTELDVMAKVASTANEPPSRLELEVQRSIYEEIARIANEQVAVESLLMWDFADDQSWLHPTIFDLGTVPFGVYTYPAPWTGGDPGSPMTKKPAYDGLVEGLAAGTAPELGVAPWRVTSNWEPTTSYLKGGDGGAALGTDTSDGTADWMFEPAGSGFHRVRVGDQYLTRQGTDDDGDGNYEASSAVELQGLNTAWSSQLWRLEPEGTNGDGNAVYRVVNGWDTATGLLTRTGVPDGDGGYTPGATVSLHEQNDWSSQRWVLEPTVDGPNPAPDPDPIAAGPEVTTASTCLAGRGRFDANIINTGSATATYRIEFAGLSPRENSVAPGDWWRMPITGRFDGTYPVTITRDGVVVSNTNVSVACQEAATTSTPQVQVINACRAGNGYILFQFANPTSTSRGYVIEFDGVSNRSTTAAAFGGAIRAVTGRQDGTYDYRIRSGNQIVTTGSITVGCDG